MAIIVALTVAAVYFVVLIVAVVLGPPDLLFPALVLSFFALVVLAVGKGLDKKGKKSLRTSLVISAVIAVVLYVVDAFVLHVDIFGQVVLVYLLVPALWALLDRRVGLRAAKVGIYLLAVVSTSVTNDLQNKMADRRTAKLGDACLAYRAKYHHYPRNLEAVVPEFISSVPIARYGLLRNDNFQYLYFHSGTFDFDEGPKLSYTDPLQKWHEYDIENHRWEDHGRLDGFN